MKIILSILLISCLIGLGSTLTCANDQIEAINNSGTAICVTEIPNCIKYNDKDNTKCHVCIGNSIPEGDYYNFTACNCTGKDTIVLNEFGDKACIATADVIPNCHFYFAKGHNLCHTCYLGAIPRGEIDGNDATDCDCTGKSFIVTNFENKPACISMEISNCHRYSLSPDGPPICHTCFNGAIRVGKPNLFE